MYRWLIYAHVGTAIAFVLAHGPSAAMALRVRRESSSEGVRALITLSSLWTRVMYPLLGLIFLTGAALGFAGHWWSRAWIWTAIAVLSAATVVMILLSFQYNALRGATGVQRGREQPTPRSPAEIRRIAGSTRPGPITTVGIIALAVLLWLMIFKPF